MTNENLQQKRYAEEMQNQAVQLRWEMSQAMAAAVSRGNDKSEAHSATTLSGAGGSLPPNSWQWTQSTQALPQQLPPQANVVSTSGGRLPPQPTGTDPLFVNDPWTYSGGDGGGPAGGSGGGDPTGGSDGGPYRDPSDPNPGFPYPWQTPDGGGGGPSGPPGGGGGGPPSPPYVPPQGTSQPRTDKEKRKKADKIDIKSMPPAPGLRAWRLAPLRRGRRC